MTRERRSFETVLRFRFLLFLPRLRKWSQDSPRAVPDCRIENVVHPAVLWVFCFCSAVSPASELVVSINNTEAVMMPMTNKEAHSFVFIGRAPYADCKRHWRQEVSSTNHRGGGMRSDQRRPPGCDEGGRNFIVGILIQVSWWRQA